MKALSKEDEIAAQLEKIAAERDELISQVKEYEKLLTHHPESIFQYAEKISAIFYLFSTDLKKIIYINSAGEQLCKQTREAIYRNPKLWFECIFEEDRQHVIESLSEMVEENKTEILLEYRIKVQDEPILYVFDRAVLIVKQGRVKAIMGFLTDLTGYVYAKREMLLYDQILSVAQTEKSTEVAIEAILKISSLSYGWDEGEVWIIDPATTTLYCIKIWHKSPEEIKEFYEKSYELQINYDEGFQGQVLKSNSPIFVNDCATKDKFIRRAAAAKTGFTSAFGLPINYQGKAHGVLIYFSKKARNLDKEQINTFQRISDVLADIIHNKISKDQMVYMIGHDKLTGLVNRSGLEEILEGAISKNSHSLIALIMVDIDHFKKINEAMGLVIGDSVLRELAIKFRDYLSDSFTAIANIGADQFVFLLSGMKRADEIAPLLIRIQALVQAPFFVKDKRLLLTISLGISIYPYDAIDALSLLKNVNTALNHAKSKGGGRIEYFSKTLQKTVTQAIKLESDLRIALSENDFRLYYQPQVNLKTGEIVGVEALLRWQNHEEGLLLPSSFIGIAEQSDMIVYIGEWILLEICRHFPLADLKIPIAINFTARQFENQYDILKFITVLLNKFSLQPTLLEIEVTESQLIIDSTRTMNVLNSLRKIGVSIALDDFGIGYSSFDYLKRFKPDKIKIDKSFIEGLPNDRENAGIVRAIIALCKSLHIKVLAEGVENAAQLQFLMEEGCDEIQGFYFAKPLPIYELRVLIDNKVKLKYPETVSPL